MGIIKDLKSVMQRKQAALTYTRGKAPLNPTAKAIQGARARYGDTAFQPIADSMLAAVKKRRASAASEKAAGY